MVFIPASGVLRFRRSVLFMPASNERALGKANSLGCDGVIFDLEDAVADNERPAALQNIRKFVSGADFGNRETIIRVNAVGSAHFAGDMTIAAESGVDAILLPKVETVAAVEEATGLLEEAGSDAVLWAMVETPMALINLADICRSCGPAAGGRLACLVVGPNDLAKETGVSLASGRAAMQPWLMQTIAAARAFGLGVLDGVYNNFRDTEGFAAECSAGAVMGFDGKTLIHPSQIDAANVAFSPSQTEIERARTIVETFEAPENTQKGAIQIEGEMIERLHLDSARKLLSLFE